MLNVAFFLSVIAMVIAASDKASELSQLESEESQNATTTATTTITDIPITTESSQFDEAFNSSVIGSRIVNGIIVNIREHPYQVSLRRKFCQICPFTHFCGGSIISPNVILTAAHCVQNIQIPSLVRVVAGTSTNLADNDNGVFHISVSQIIIHDGYVTQMLDNDIAILLLESNLPMDDDNILSIELARHPPIAGRIGSVTGWGATSHGGGQYWHLLKADLPIIDHELCRHYYFQMDQIVTDGMICAGGGSTGACYGDSGGPMVVDQKLAGIVSWGHMRCDMPGYPTVFTNVPKFLPWIEQQLGIPL